MVVEVVVVVPLPTFSVDEVVLDEEPGMVVVVVDVVLLVEVVDEVVVDAEVDVVTSRSLDTIVVVVGAKVTAGTKIGA